MPRNSNFSSLYGLFLSKFHLYIWAFNSLFSFPFHFSPPLLTFRLLPRESTIIEDYQQKKKKKKSNNRVLKCVIFCFMILISFFKIFYFIYNLKNWFVCCTVFFDLNWDNECHLKKIYIYIYIKGGKRKLHRPYL